MSPSDGGAGLDVSSARRLIATGEIPAPSSWLIQNVDLLPGRDSLALDVACGAGRNALFLAAAGLRVRAADRDAEALGLLEASAARLALPVTVEMLDLERPAADLGAAAYVLIVVTHYLHRPLFAALRRALAPGGVLIYETFTVDQASMGHPRNPAFLLEHGELQRLVAPLAILRERDGEFEGRRVAGVAARAPG